jgi:hypothetical protein
MVGCFMNAMTYLAIAVRRHDEMRWRLIYPKPSSAAVNLHGWTDLSLSSSGCSLGTDATSILDGPSQHLIRTNLRYDDASELSHVILTTFDPSATPAKLLAWTPPSVLRASNSSHHPKRKSRAISLNHGVKELPINGTSKRYVATRVRFLHTLVLKHRL